MSAKSHQKKTGARDNRITEVIAHEAAEFISRETGSNSLITVIRAERSRAGRLVTVFVSVYPDTKARSALHFLERQRENFSVYLKAKVRIGPLPRIDFLLDNREDEKL